MVLIIQLIHLAVCIGLIVIVLFQADKSEGLAGAFGGGASNTIFGERGSGGFVSNLTTALAVIFMITSIYLSVYAPKVSSRSSRPVINYNNNIPAQPTEIPATQAEIPVTPAEENTMAPTAVAPVAPNEVAPAPAPSAVPVTTPAIAPTETTAPAETAVPTPAPAPAETTTPAAGQ